MEEGLMKQLGKFGGGEIFHDLKETLAQGSLAKNSPILVEEWKEGELHNKKERRPKRQGSRKWREVEGEGPKNKERELGEP